MTVFPSQAVQQTLALPIHLPFVHRYSVMLTKCWDVDPDARATFFELKSSLENLISTNEGNPPVDLEHELQQQARGEHSMGSPA